MTGLSLPMASYVKRSSLRPLGIILCLMALWLIVALTSYHSGDPSLNRTSTMPPHNWMGMTGAWVADLLLQLFGLGAASLPITLGAWGWRLHVDRKISYFRYRFCGLLLVLVASAALCAFLPPFQAWPIGSGMGGNMGRVMMRLSTSIMPDIVASLLFILLCGVGVIYSMALKRQEWQKMGGGVTLSGSYLWSILCHFYDRLIKDDQALHGNRQSSVQPIEEKTLNKKIRTLRQSTESASERSQSSETEHTSRAQSIERKVTVGKDQKNTPKQQSLELRNKNGAFELPSLSLLSDVPRNKMVTLNESALTQNATMLEAVLHDFGVKGEIINIRPGPVVTLYELEPSPGTKSSRVIGLADDIARSMSAISARIAVIPGRNALGIELPNSNRQTVYMREILEHESFADSKSKLPMALGKNIGGEPIVVDLAKMPHLLVAGTTGSGKSVAINTMITSLLYHHTPDTCRFIMIDPKMLELSVYNDIPHLLTPVVTEPGKAIVALKWTVKEMENRYRLMASLGVRNVENYNKRVAEAKKNGETLSRQVQTGFDSETGQPTYESQKLDLEPLPFIVVVVDEMADLMLVAGKEIEGSIQRLAQMARAAGIHIIMATQRPSVDVITGVIKANFPTRISFQVTSKIDSRTILGEQGAEQLLGQGDMLYMAGGGRISRVHGPFISDHEVEEIVTHLKKQAPPEYVEDVTYDESSDESSYDDAEESEEDRALYDRAVAIVARDRKASTSYIQRCLKIGYNRAASLIEKMEREGVVSSANHVGKREVLVPEARDY
ncbi:MAG: DNA translocase FtsK [Alphaproteobacteria bacterium]|nr:MAG: DNA translocase FtsK [Alphaproteobacteria bacterium]TAF14537.1 MAG: DNA translocase FtsK [Alphaproteobacteria bacterium]TAF38517.1 MAG: DNA translocase FtsK [Alphaproteobacteria bacterium]TAF74916.1 MAG: DNA translocase FtsK [Alphaproteobacteria bacterium]